MKAFADLFEALDQTTKTKVRLDALVQYFKTAPADDAVWCIALLTHRRPKRTVNTRLLREWASEEAGIPLWLFENTYHIVGDLAETIALVTQPVYRPSGREAEKNTVSLSQVMHELMALGDADETAKRSYITRRWSTLDQTERLVFNKLITGGFRMGVSARNLTKALALYTGKDVNALAHRLMGNWDPTTTDFEALVMADDTVADASKPYPFFLAYPVEGEPEAIGRVDEFIAEDKWDGIRAQVIVRSGELFIWSRGEELVTDKYPELAGLVDSLPDGTVLDGELVCHNGSDVLPFALLQTRIGRKTVSKKLLAEAPVKLIAYDLLEHGGRDIRSLSQHERRSLLETLHAAHATDVLLLSRLWVSTSWDALKEVRATARERQSEGLMLKHRDAPYEVGRKRGAWWKWKLDPFTVDAVMIYAMRGHGRRANLYTDYTFAVWNAEGELVPFTKAYSGLTDKEFTEVDRFVKANTLERFGPVRSVKPEMVFELAFEGIARSTRHKSGIALRFPRMVRIRYDKKPEDAGSLEELEGLL